VTAAPPAALEAPAALLGPVGQEPALAELRHLFSAEGGPRTLLFAGPEEVGRRLAARWLFALLNCLAPGPAERPCGECESCHLTLLNAHPDLKVVTPALTTDTGRAKRNLEIRIDQLVARERGDPEPLVPWLRTRPRYRARVGVVDHADTMNAPAANSFLKALEEPPPWAVIVLVAPGPDALLPTVASRCVTVRFAAVDVVALQGSGGLPVLTPELVGHPAIRLGQPGALVKAFDAADETATAKNAAEDFLDAVAGDLLEALLGAEALAKALSVTTEASTGPLGWLREMLRRRDVVRYAAALDAVDRCERAMAAYSQVSLACAVLALELRRIG